MNDIIKKITNKLKLSGFVPEGYSAKELEDFQNSYKISLPSVYKDFQSVLGKNAGPFMKGSDFKLSEIEELKKAANETLDENNLPPLPDNAFVFWMHQGYQFAFFYLDEGDDPEIYTFDEIEKNKGFKKKFDSLTIFFVAMSKG